MRPAEARRDGYRGRTLIARKAVKVGVVAGIACAAYMLGAASTADTPQPVQPVSVSIIYDQYGEASDVDLTDGNGHWIPTGSIAESWPDDTDD